MRTAATILVGALVATPAEAAPRVRAGIDLSLTFGASRPFGIGLSTDVSVPAFDEQTGLMIGGGTRFDVFPGSGVQWVLEPLVGAGLLPNPSSCEFSPRFVFDVRPGLALRSRGGPAMTFATSAQFSQTLGGQVRFGGAVPLAASPRREARADLGMIQDLTLTVGPHLTSLDTCIVGRPLREDGEMVLAEAEGATHSSVLAADWLEQAREEHAAVAAFLRLAAELEALGAPDALVQACRASAAEEAVHARLCLQRAAEHAGAPAVLDELVTAPRAFASRAEALATLAHESWHDGFVNEGRAAEVARQAAQRATDPADRAVHLRIAREEAVHAELGARITAWCLAA